MTRARALGPYVVGGIAAALFALAMSPRSASAQRVVHRVRLGQTLASISQHYYGNKDLALFIRLSSGRDDPLRAGERLRVPTAWVHTVRKTTRLPNLARQLLGDRRRAVVLATLNGLGRRRRARVGQRLIIPFTIAHRVRPGETFAAISSRYYGNAARAKLIASYNFMRRGQPAADTRLEIPIVRVRLLPQRLEELTNARLLGVSPARQQHDREALWEANGLLREGQYERVPLRLIRLLAREQPSDTYIAEVFKLLAISFVAVGQQDLAARAFREAISRQPTMTLEADQHSPKVIRAFTQARREIKAGR